MSVKLRSTVIRAFKMHGLSLRSEASDYLREILEPVNEVEREDWIDRIIEAVQRQTLENNIIDADVVEAAVQDCNSEEGGVDEILTVYDAFSIPKYTFKQENKKFVKDKRSLKLISTAEDKAVVFQERYNLLHQRTIRHKLFTPPIKGVEDETNAKKFNLKTVEYLLSCSNKVKDIIVLGMLTQVKERKHHLEDPTGMVELDLANTKFHAGLFTENCFVLAEGWYDDMIFHVTAFGFPPPEAASTTRAYYGNINFFGGPQEQINRSEKLLRIEKDNTEAMFVIAFDIWLDKETTLEKMELMLQGFSSAPPLCFLFSGSFCSTPYGADHASKLKDGFKKLGEIFSQYPSIIESSKVIFIPSFEDVISTKVIPRPCVPKSLVSAFLKKVPNAIFTTNPCRIKYCTQEIVVYRNDIVHKMTRNCIKCPAEDITTHFIKTLVAQAHLSPLPLHIAPVYWQYDQALRLYPLPDLCLILDKTCERFQEKMDIGCQFVNPGSFSSRDFGFSVYYPANGIVEECSL